MNFFVSKKPKTHFTLKPIESSSLFVRRASNSNCPTNNDAINRQMPINHNLSHEDKQDKITNTVTRNSADNKFNNGKKFQAFSEIGGNMETQLGKSVLIQVNSGLVE